MVFGYGAKARCQHVLHVKTRIGRQNNFLIVITQLTITESAVVTGDAVLTAGHVRALMLRNRRGGVERDRVPTCLCTALANIMRRGKGTADVRPHNLEATIGSSTARKADIVQKHRHCDQLGIRSEPATLCQLRAIEPRAHHMVEKPGLRFRFCLCVGVPNGATVRENQIQLSADCQRTAAIRASTKSMPAVTPPPDRILPPLTMRPSPTMAPKTGSNSRHAQWQAARRPWRKPAAPRMSDPVQTEVR